MNDMEFLNSEASRLDKTAEYIKRDIESIDEIVAISEYTAGCIKEYYPVTEEDITIIHNCVDTATFNPQNQQYDSSILDNLGINEPYFFHISGGQPRKNVGLMLDSIEMVEIDMTYVFAGGAADKVKKELVDRDLDKEQFVLITKRLNDLELAAIYRNAFSLLYPSEAEGFGYPIAECMACGTNCIVSNKGAIPEVAGKNANYIRDTTAEHLAQKIKQVYAQDREDSNEKVANRIQREFNVYKFANEYSNLYSKYIN
jgi:alpha-1,3-rhamnosyl/mannosyltransferase